MIYMTANFTLDEAVLSETAVRKGIVNKPDLPAYQNMRNAALKLEAVRKITGALHVNSWYRCPEVNKLVGGSPESAHMTGWAIDVTSTKYSPYELCAAVINSGLEFDQIILEYDRWMHISFAPTSRKQVLSIYKPGIYLKGLVKQ